MRESYGSARLVQVPVVVAAVVIWATQAAGAGAADQLDLAKLRPYLPRGPGAAGRAALHAGRYGPAARALRQHLARKRGSSRDRQQARYLLGVALFKGRKFRAAERVFSDLVRAYPLLSDYHRFHRARALYRLRDFTSAAAAAASVDRSSVLHTDAELVRADALRSLGRAKEAVAIWEAYLKRHARGRRRGEAHFRVAEALSKTAPRRALFHYQRVVVHSPLHKLRVEAERRARQLATKLDGGAKLVRLDGDQRFAQAMVYYRKMRNARSEAAFAAVLRAKNLPPKRRCRASYLRAKSVYKARQRQRAAPLFAQAARDCRAAGVSEMVVKSLYNRARGLSRKKDYRGAAAQYLALEREFSSHSYADDARLRAAEVYQAWGKKTKVRQLLSSLPGRYPSGDMAREALWRLARDAYLAGRHEQSLKHLDRILKELGRARHSYAEGQALYWKARILDLKRRRGAADHYERCIREYPLSYYSLLAFNRLRERHRRRYRKLRRQLILSVGKRKVRPPRVALGPLAKDRHFRRGLELARLGFGSDAARELKRTGLGIGRRTPPKRLWLAAALFHEAGIWRLSHQVPRSRDSRYKREHPHGDNLRRWQIAYPWAFPLPVTEEARRSQIPPQLVLSIMREESGFSPQIESYANAVGLMQLILPTARAAGARFKLPRVDRAVLHDPATNIKLGAYHLGWLNRTFSGNMPLTIASYNAGHGAVQRWLRRFGRAKLDELIERIPYDQTRNYTKRVLSSFFAYSVVHRLRPRIPRIEQALPKVIRARLRPKKATRKRPAGKKP